MYERTFETVTIPGKSTRRIRFLQQRKNRLFTGVTVIDGGDDIRIGQVTIGARFLDRVGGDNPVPWVSGTYAAVEIHNDSSQVRQMTVEMNDRAESDPRDARSVDERIANPAAKVKIAHTITIFVMEDGSVYGEVDRQVLMPIGTELTSESTTIDGQARSILDQAFHKMIEADFTVAPRVPSTPPKGGK